MEYETNKCWSCGGKYEFLPQEIGRVWNCPHCDSQVVLTPTRWWIKIFTTRRKTKSSLPDLPKAETIIQSPSFVEMQTAKAARKKAVVCAILWTCLIGVFFGFWFFQPNEPSYIRPPPIAPSKPPDQLPEFASTSPIQPVDDRVLPNGTILVRMDVAGKGSLTIENGTSKDAAIKLMANPSFYYYFYVSANNSFKLQNVLDGYYRVLYQTGNDWDGRGFTRNLSCARFDNALNFSTTRTTRYDGVYSEFTTYTLTLQPVKNGTATTTPISIAEFMR
jgi:DNA-directed RNA polymerase subunit RPC12/RpoP